MNNLVMDNFLNYKSIRLFKSFSGMNIINYNIINYSLNHAFH